MIRPKTISLCPRILELLFKQGMEGDPRKRPNIRLVYEIMSYMNSQINRQPIKPIVEPGQCLNDLILLKNSQKAELYSK